MAYVMVVDDDEDFALATALVLRNAGHEVQVELETGTALKSMEDRSPDLAILDVMFPENPSAGFELARQMRHDTEQLKEIPLLMLTAVNTKFPMGLGFGDIDNDWLPATEFLEKPVDPDVLQNKVADLLKQNGSRGQH